MSDTGLHFDASRVESAYERLDQAVMAARQLATESNHKHSEEPASSAADELAYLLASQAAEASHDFALGAVGAFVAQRPEQHAAIARPQEAAPLVGSQADGSISAQMPTYPSVLAPWLQLMGPAVITAQIVAVVVLVIVWMPGLLSESVAQVFGRKGRIPINPSQGSTIVAQADIPQTNFPENEAVPSTVPSEGADEPTIAAISSKSPAPPAPVDVQSAEPATDAIPSLPVEPLPTTDVLSVRNEADGMITEGTPEEAGAVSPPSPTVPVPGPAAPVLTPADPSANAIPAAADGLSREETSVATVTEEQPEPLSPGEEVPAGEPSAEAQHAAMRPDRLPVEEKPDVMPAPETGHSLSLEVPHSVPVPPNADTPAPAPVERLVKMAEELATENRAALERERERADALAHELALVREELDALRLRPPYSWGTAFPLVIPAPEATQVADTEIPPAKTAEPASTGPMTAPLPTPSTENNHTASISSLPPPPQTSSANEQRLVDRAEALLQARDISGARLLLERAAEHGSARGAYLLAQTYDPSALAQWRVRGILGDPEKARKFYEQSRMLAARKTDASTMLR